MSYDEALKTVSLNADSSIGIFTGPPGIPGSAVPNSGKQYCGVKVTGKNQVGLSVLAANNCVGILHNKPQEPGAAATVAISGISPAVAGAAVSAGDEVSTDSTGRFITAAGTGKGKKFIAVEPAAGAGQLFSVLIIG